MAATQLSDRSVIRLSGDDVRGFLQGLVTQDVCGPLPVWAALLTPQGKCLFDFFVWDAGGDDVAIDCAADDAEALIRRLSVYRLRRAITITRDAGLAVHWAPDGEQGTADPRLAAIGRRWLAAADAGPAAQGDASDAYRAHRLALGVTEGAAELGAGETLWLECNAAELNGVSFTKGCYIGQENTARMNWRQKVNRRLVVVPIADADGKRQRVVVPDLGWSIELRRIADIPVTGWRNWMGARPDSTDAGESSAE